MGPLYHSSPSPHKVQGSFLNRDRRLFAPEVRKDWGGRVSLGPDRVLFSYSQWLWLPAQDLPKIKPSNIPASMEKAS